MAKPRRGGRPQRQQKKTALVVGEGRETEFNYFVALHLDASTRYSLTVKRGVGLSPVKAVQRAIELTTGNSGKYDEIWIVVDVEGVSNRAALEEARTLASRHRFHVCLSNPAIEVWFLAHFDKVCGEFIDCDSVLPKLQMFWKRAFEMDYSKSDEDIYSRLRPTLPTAITNATWTREQSPQHKDVSDTADCNSSTDMYRLVKRFLNV